MWWKEGLRRSGTYRYKKRRFNLIDSRFHSKYFLLFLGGAALFAAIAFSLVTYFVMQNYQMFIDYAYNNFPQFVPNLEFERKWILIAIAACYLGLLAFIGFTCYSLINSIVYPLRVMRKHIDNLTKGDMSQPELRVRLDSDYQDLVQTYNYFYRTLQRHSKQELQQLQSLEISKNAHRSKRLLDNILAVKEEQLNGSSLEHETPRDSDLVS